MNNKGEKTEVKPDYLFSFTDVYGNYYKMFAVKSAGKVTITEMSSGGAVSHGSTLGYAKTQMKYKLNNIPNGKFNAIIADAIAKYGAAN
jgi:ABC-type Zn2+ transport system substrate-binding protein/surface adhesin